MLKDEFVVQSRNDKVAMGYIERVSGQIAALLVREGLDYYQSKAVFKAARQQAGLTPPQRPRKTVDRLTLEEELRFIDHAYAQGGRTGLMMQSLLETGTRVSEFVQLRVEDVSFAERLIVIQRGKGGKRREVPLRRRACLNCCKCILASAARGHYSRVGNGELGQCRMSIRASGLANWSARWHGMQASGSGSTPICYGIPWPRNSWAWGWTLRMSNGFWAMTISRPRRFMPRTSSAALRKKFDLVTDPDGQALIQELRQHHGEQVAAFASELLVHRGI